MKKGALKNNKIFFESLILIILVVGFVFAANTITVITVGGTNYSQEVNATEDTLFLFNISINNTDTGAAANVTEVNITLPGSFVFTNSNNGTSVAATGHAFTNTTTILSWDNDTLIENSSGQFFWFNVTASTPGDYGISVLSLNGTADTTTNITIYINDTTAPSAVAYVSPSDAAFSNVTKSDFAVNFSITDNGLLDTVFIELFNFTHELMNTSNATNLSTNGNAGYVNFTGLADGVYYINATANDSTTNSNSSLTRKILLDTVAPTISFSCSPLIVVVDATITCDCSTNDSTNINNASRVSGVSTTTNVANPVTTTLGTFTATCNSTDKAFNNATSSESYTVDSFTSGGGGGVTSTQIKKKTNSWSKITPGTTTTIKDFDKDFGLNKITFSVFEEAQNVQIVIKKYSAKPTTISKAKSGTVYKYLEIDTDNLESKLSNAVITIQVEKSWVSSSSNVDKDGISLAKWDKTNKEWDELKTDYVREDADNYYYEVKTTSFSFFAISGVRGQAVQETVDSDEVVVPPQPTTDDSAGLKQEKGSSGLWIGLIVVAVLIIAGIIYLKKKKGSETQL